MKDEPEHTHHVITAITLRDYFAGQALGALITKHRADVHWSEMAPRAYQIADAMLAERKKNDK